MIRATGRYILTEYDRNLVLELSATYNRSSVSFINKFDSEIIINWPDLTLLINALIDDDMVVAKRLYFAHILEIAKQLYDEEPAIKVEVFVSQIWSKNVLVSQVVLKLIKNNLTEKRIGTILSQFNCPPTVVIRLRNPQITEEYLKLQRPEATFDDCKDIFELLVNSVDVRQLEILLEHAQYFSRVTCVLYKLVINNLFDLHQFEAGRNFINRVFRSDIFNESTFADLELALINIDKKNLQIFLESDVRTIIKSKLDGQDILSCVFGNSNLEAQELLKNQKIDVNMRGQGDLSPLHFAARSRAKENIRMLLERGFDPNALDCFEYTPLHHALKYQTVIENTTAAEECLKLLLMAGADPLFIYKDKILRNYRSPHPTFFGIRNCDWHEHELQNIIQYLVAQLAIYDALGLSVEIPIEDYMRLQIEGGDCFYEKCRNQLKQLKTHQIRNSFEFHEHTFTMFTLISNKSEKIARYISEQDRSVVASFMNQYNNESSFIPYYYNMLKYRINIIDQISNFIEDTKSVLSEFIQVDVNHLIMHQILGY